MVDVFEKKNSTIKQEENSCLISSISCTTFQLEKYLPLGYQGGRGGILALTKSSTPSPLKVKLLAPQYA